MGKKQIKTTTVQLPKYGVIGASNTLITLVVFYVLNTLLGAAYGLANTIGYILGLINSFVWNRNWVFKTKVNIKKEAALFAVGFLICFALQMTVSWYLLEVADFREIEIPFLPMKKPGENIVMVLSMVVYTVCNYIYNRFVTFKKPGE